MGRPLWLVELIKIGFPGRFLIAKLTKVPIIGRILDHWLFEGDDIIYLPRDGGGSDEQASRHAGGDGIAISGGGL